MPGDILVSIDSSNIAPSEIQISSETNIVTDASILAETYSDKLSPLTKNFTQHHQIKNILKMFITVVAVFTVFQLPIQILWLHPFKLSETINYLFITLNYVT